MLPLINKAGNPGRITILLVEDHALVREGVRSLLDLEAGFEVVGEAQDGRTAVSQVKKLRPAVVVMDIAMPLLNGLEATRQIRLAVPDTKVLVLSAHSDDAYIEQVAALGAAGYLIKQTSADWLAKAIREVEKGNTFFSPAIAEQLRDHYESSPDRTRTVKRKGQRLSSREVEVLQLIAEGQANKQVATELQISLKTVEKHRQRLMQKLSIHDTAGLTRHAIAAGVIESSVQVTIV